MSLESVVNQLMKPSYEKRVDKISLELLEKLEALVAATTIQSEELRRLIDIHHQTTHNTEKDCLANRKKLDQLREENLILNSPDFDINGESSSSARVWTLENGDSINASSAQESIPVKKVNPRHAGKFYLSFFVSMLDIYR